MNKTASTHGSHNSRISILALLGCRIGESNYVVILEISSKVIFSAAPFYETKSVDK